MRSIFFTFIIFIYLNALTDAPINATVIIMPIAIDWMVVRETARFMIMLFFLT